MAAKTNGVLPLADKPRTTSFLFTPVFFITDSPAIESSSAPSISSVSAETPPAMRP
jgi:hypothetical protein